eukprot:1535899-Pyramimonas_sp.AAC.1
MGAALPTNATSRAGDSSRRRWWKGGHDNTSYEHSCPKTNVNMTCAVFVLVQLRKYFQLASSHASAGET